MSLKRISSTAVAPNGGPPSSSAKPWTSSIYPRFTLSAEEVHDLYLEFVGTPDDPGPLSIDEARFEIRESQYWLKGHPTTAAKRRAWYRYLRTWLRKAAEAKVYRKRRQSARGSQGRYYEGGGDSADRNRALGLD